MWTSSSKFTGLAASDQKEGTFYCDFMLMMDWVDESLSLVAPNEVPDFRNHFWPKVELMNMCPDQDDLEFGNSNYYPKHKIDRKAEGDQVHRATITMKVAGCSSAAWTTASSPLTIKSSS